MALAFPKGGNETLDRLRVATGPGGETTDDSKTVPLKPLTLDTKTVEAAEEPAFIVRLLGNGVSVKFAA